MNGGMPGTPAARIAPWRHITAIVLLPALNTVVIPSAILELTHAGNAIARIGSIGDLAGLLVGTVLIAGGAALAAHAIRQFVAMGEGTLAPWDPARRLLVRGAYRFTRNPLKIGLFAMLLGEAAMFRSTALLVWFALFAAANAVYVRVAEEPGLSRRFGDDYFDYRAHVPRWIPAIRAKTGARLERAKRP